MRITEITESEDTDHAARIEANEAFDRIKDYLDKHKDYLGDLLSPSNALGGCYVLKARKVGVGEIGDDLLIIFTPRQGDKRGAFGHAGEHPVIVLAVLRGPSDLTYLDTRISSQRSIFTHEYQHYLAWSRGATNPKTADAALNKSHDDYYNHTDELNAHYQEGASDFYRIITNLISWDHGEKAFEMWGSKSTPDLVKDIMSDFMNKDWIASLTPDNRRRIEKRTARFVEQTIRPLFPQA